MKTLKLAALISLLAFTACNNDEFYEIQSTIETEKTLESRSLESVEEEIEYPLYHVVYDPTTEMLNITLDPQYKDYNPGVYTHIYYFLDVEKPDGSSRRYGGAFPIKGRCWADMTNAFVGFYTMHLYINGVEFNTTTFVLNTTLDFRHRDGNITFETATFGN